MAQTPVQVAANLLAEERDEMKASASLLATRLTKLVANGGEPGLAFDLPAIHGLLTRMRDSIESYRIARAVHRAVADLAPTEE